jgi:hypothetical protein
MKLFRTIIGAALILLGLVWILQGSGMLAGSVMTGQSQWLYTGIVVAIIGAGTIFTTYRRRT